MLTLYKSEKEVEVKLLHPLFRDILGYPEEELDWAVPVQMNLGREKKIKEADLVAKYKGRNAGGLVGFVAPGRVNNLQATHCRCPRSSSIALIAQSMGPFGRP